MKQYLLFLITLFSISNYCIGQDNIQYLQYVSPKEKERQDAVKYLNQNQFFLPYIELDSNFYLESWFSRELSIFKEPVIYLDTSKKEIFRFTWLRSFHHPIVIRIENSNGKYLLFWKESDLIGGRGTGNIIIDKQKILTKQIWETFIAKLNNSNFWELITLQDNLPQFQGLSYNDGAEWILEGKAHGIFYKNCYHFVQRQFPDESSKIYQVCNFLLDLTDLKIKKIEKY